MKIHENIKQGTPEWKALRCGKFTASNFDKLFMGKSTLGYQTLINTIVYERLTLDIPDSYSNKDMERGIELEPIAREAYELETFNKVKQVGFIEADDWRGYSPDGLVGEDGLLEVKCPKFNTWINYKLFPEKLYEEYKYQVQGGLWIAERKWIDLTAYHPKLGLIIQRILPGKDLILGISKETLKAQALVEQRIKTIKESK
jgi:hypothetical protein